MSYSRLKTYLFHDFFQSQTAASTVLAAVCDGKKYPADCLRGSVTLFFNYFMLIGLFFTSHSLIVCLAPSSRLSPLSISF